MSEVTLDRLLTTVESLRSEFRQEIIRVENSINQNVGKIESSVDSVRKDFATMEAGRLSKLEGTVTRLELLLNGVIQTGQEKKKAGWQQTLITIIVSVALTFLVTYFLNNVLKG